MHPSTAEPGYRRRQTAQPGNGLRKTSTASIVLGIDPGTLVTGYGVILRQRNSLRLLGSGTVRNPAAASMPLRLKRIYQELCSVIQTYQAGVRHVPKIYLMAGRNLGARGLLLFLYVLLPASQPHLVSGLKQGWAFAWRSLISGEMIFVSLGLGHLLMMGRDLNDMSQVVAVMAIIMAIGHIVDRLLFERLENRIRHKWGLVGAA